MQNRGHRFGQSTHRTDAQCGHNREKRREQKYFARHAAGAERFACIGGHNERAANRERHETTELIGDNA